MAYAIIRSGGKQFRVEEGATVRVPLIDVEPGEIVEVEALAVATDKGVRIGSPTVDARLGAVVVEHGRGDKVIVFKKKRRKQYKRTKGHRQDYTTLKIGPIK